MLVTYYLASRSESLAMGYKYSAEERTLPGAVDQGGESGREKGASARVLNTSLRDGPILSSP